MPPIRVGSFVFSWSGVDSALSGSAPCFRVSACPSENEGTYIMLSRSACPVMNLGSGLFLVAPSSDIRLRGCSSWILFEAKTP